MLVFLLFAPGVNDNDTKEDTLESRVDFSYMFTITSKMTVDFRGLDVRVYSATSRIQDHQFELTFESLCSVRLLS